METGGKACLFMKAQGLRIDRKHVCLRRGHVVSLGLQYAKMSSTDPKKAQLLPSEQQKHTADHT